MGEQKNAVSLTTKIANILANDSTAIGKRKQIYLALGLNGANDFFKLNKDAEADSFNFFYGMVDLHFERTGEDIALGIDRLLAVLKTLELNRCAGEVEQLGFSRSTSSEKPFIFNIENFCDNFIGREHDLKILEDLVVKRQKEQLNAAVLTSVSGMGGIGKTMLAKKFAYTFNQKYDANIAWIPCETQELVKNSFTLLYNQLNFSNPKLPETNKLMAKLIFEKLRASSKETLFIFDNLDDPDAEWIWDFVPTQEKRIYSLITSRRQDIPTNNTYNLNILTPEDATLLVKKELKDLSDNIVKRLIETLGNFPLAIQIATSIIGRSTTISKDEATLDYIENFTLAKEHISHAAKVLKLVGYHLTTNASIKISIDKVDQMEDGKEIKHLLFLCSFLYSEKIYKEMLEKLLLVSNEKENTISTSCFSTESTGLGKYLEKLNNFSLIIYESKSGYYRMHRLVQESVRQNLTKPEMDVILNQFVQFFNQTNVKEYHQHIDTLLHCCFKELKQNLISVQVFKNLYKSANFLGDDSDFRNDDMLSLQFVEQNISRGFTIVDYYASWEKIRKSRNWKPKSKFQNQLSELFEKIEIDDIDIQTVLVFTIMQDYFEVKSHLISLHKHLNVHKKINVSNSKAILKLEKQGILGQVEEYLQNNGSQFLLVERHFRLYLRTCRKLKIDESISSKIEKLKHSEDFGYLFPVWLIHNSETGDFPEIRYKYDLHYYLEASKLRSRRFVSSLTYGQLYSTIFSWNIKDLFRIYSNFDRQLRFGISLFNSIEAYLKTRSESIQPEEIHQICKFLSGRSWSLEELPAFLKKYKLELDTKLTKNNIRQEIISAFTQYSIFNFLSKDEDLRNMFKNIQTLPSDFKQAFLELDFIISSKGVLSEDKVISLIFAASATIEEKVKAFRLMSSSEYLCIFGHSLYFSSIACNGCFTLYDEVQKSPDFDENMLLLPVRLHRKLQDRGYYITLDSPLLKLFINALCSTSQNSSTNPELVEWKNRFQECFKELDYTEPANERIFKEKLLELLHNVC